MSCCQTSCTLALSLSGLSDGSVELRETKREKFKSVLCHTFNIFIGSWTRSHLQQNVSVLCCTLEHVSSFNYLFPGEALASLDFLRGELNGAEETQDKKIKFVWGKDISVKYIKNYFPSPLIGFRDYWKNKSLVLNYHKKPTMHCQCGRVGILKTTCVIPLHVDLPRVICLSVFLQATR